MSEKVKHHIGDRDIQLILGTLLRVGVVLSMVIVLFGGILYLFEQGNTKVDYSEFNPKLVVFTTIPAIFNGLLALKSAAIIQFGILLLIFTPIMRIVFSIYSFVLEGDYMYVIIGLIVLGIILFSLQGGYGH